MMIADFKKRFYLVLVLTLPLMLLSKRLNTGYTFHIRNIYEKLHVNSKSEVVVKVMRDKIG
ncbi:MAG: hypothetical protein JWP78_1731 [Mucilaginibacter sp.]|nr:hypothetical protein [Mucilaginibacter sp.]